MPKENPSSSKSAALKGVKPRKHGYRGYGSAYSKSGAGTVHWGRGFGGVEPMGVGSGATLPQAQLFSDGLKDRK